MLTQFIIVIISRHKFTNIESLYCTLETDLLGAHYMTVKIH